MTGDMRDRLIELIISAKRDDPEIGSFTEFLADHLIANGVILRERGEWCRRSMMGEVIDYRCSNCFKTNDEASPYCPNCGAKMDGREEQQE